MKVQFEVNGGSAVLSILKDDGTAVSIPLDGFTRDGTPRIERLVEKLAKAADKVASGSSYRYALRI